jgi:hypothetical protein
VAPAGQKAPADKSAPGGKKVSGPPASAAPGGKKTSQANKPVVDRAAAETRKPNSDQALLSQDAPAQNVAAQAAAPQATAPRATARISPRLSRSGAPGAKAANVGLWQVLGAMTLAAGVLSVFLLAILRGGQEAAS